jgi:hypothetical protein
VDAGYRGELVARFLLIQALRTSGGQDFDGIDGSKLQANFCTVRDLFNGISLSQQVMGVSESFLTH